MRIDITSRREELLMIRGFMETLCRWPYRFLAAAALIALLLVVIGVMTNARQDTRPETVATDSVAADGVNRVVDSNLW